MEELQQRAAELLNICRSKNIKISAAESCTGGMLSSVVTDVPGSSDVFERGFVTYSNRAKTELLGVSIALIADKGAVSEEVATEMAKGALKNSDADVSVAITGIAGPDGGSKERPVGLVHIACAKSDGVIIHKKHIFIGKRGDVKKASVSAAIDLLLSVVSS